MPNVDENKPIRRKSESINIESYLNHKRLQDVYYFKRSADYALKQTFLVSYKMIIRQNFKERMKRVVWNSKLVGMKHDC